MLRIFAPFLSAGLLALFITAAPVPVFGQDAVLPDPATQEVLDGQEPVGLDAIRAEPAGPDPAPLFAPLDEPAVPVSELGEAAAGAASIYWGAYIQGNTYGVGNAPWDSRAIDAFEAHAGKRITILHWGQAWWRCAPGCAYQEFRAQQPQYAAMWQRGIVPMVDWASWNSAVTPQYNQPDFSLQRIIDGAHDVYIRRWAREARAWGHPFFLRFNWEMNGTWFPWSETRNGNKSGQYVKAWRHVRDIFRAEGATNVKWVWCPNIVDPRSTVPLSNYYPGSTYVDWLCMDGYNWGTNPIKPSGWTTFTDLFQRTYTQLGWLSSSKPIMIGETSSSEYGGSKAAWIADALAVLPQKFPRVHAVVWFNWNADKMDWVIETSPGSQAAFARGIASSYYRSGPYNGSIATASLPEVTCASGGCIYLPVITRQ